MAEVFIGTSGYAYRHWKGVFYPNKLPSSQWLAFYCEHFSTVELNNPFYRLPSRDAFVRWKQGTPAGFTFAVKFSRFLTHVKRLKEPEGPLDRFYSRAGGLGSKLGPVLFQLPPNFKPDLDRLRSLLMLRSKDQRWVLEFRNSEWFTDKVLDTLREYGASFCVHDATEGCPTAVTARLAYLRLHGTPTHDGNYDRRALRKWARQIEEWLAHGIDVYAYFNNDVGGYAVANAKQLIEMASVAA